MQYNYILKSGQLLIHFEEGYLYVNMYFDEKISIHFSIKICFIYVLVYINIMNYIFKNYFNNKNINFNY